MFWNKEFLHESRKRPIKQLLNWVFSKKFCRHFFIRKKILYWNLFYQIKKVITIFQIKFTKKRKSILFYYTYKNWSWINQLEHHLFVVAEIIVKLYYHLYCWSGSSAIWKDKIRYRKLRIYQHQFEISKTHFWFS